MRVAPIQGVRPGAGNRMVRMVFERAFLAPLRGLFIWGTTTHGLGRELHSHYAASRLVLTFTAPTALAQALRSETRGEWGRTVNVGGSSGV